MHLSHVLKDEYVSHIATMLEGEYPKWKTQREQRYYGVPEWISRLTRTI